MPLTHIDKIAEFGYTGTVAALGGLANYLYALSQGKKFHFGFMVITVTLGFYIGIVIGQFIPADFFARDGILSISGFSVFTILRTLETKSAEFILKNVFKMPETTGDIK